MFLKILTRYLLATENVASNSYLYDEKKSLTLRSNKQESLMEKENTVRIDIGGKTVEGLITHRSNHAITVKITKPYAGLSRGANQMLNAPPARNYAGKDGDKRAKELLLELHEIACFINDNAERFKQGHEAYISEKKALEKQFEPLDEKKKALRGLLKRGELSQTEHQQRRKKLSLERNEIQEKMETAYRQHVLSLFVDERCKYGGDGLEEFIRNLD